MTNVIGLSQQHTGCPESRGTPSVDQEASAFSGVAPGRVERSAPWPFKSEDHSALAWWRMLPPDSINTSDRELLRRLLGQIVVLHGDSEQAAALRGDTDAAIGAALATMPISEITLQTDIVMTTVLSSAVCGNATSALVMAQVLGLTDLDHPFAIPLAAAWFAHGLRHSIDPDKFWQSKAVLAAAFRERHGDKADLWLQHFPAMEPDA